MLFIEERRREYFMDYQKLSSPIEEGTEPPKIGYLAEKFGGVAYPLEVLSSAAGFYLGTFDESGEPYSRESVEYWSTHEQAEAALNSTVANAWTQRCTP